MTHLVLMKFQDNFLNDANLSEISEAYQELKKALPEEIYNVNIYRNIVARESNMDIMIELELKNADSLPIYLTHPIHQAISTKMNPYVITRVSFDHV